MTATPSRTGVRATVRLSGSRWVHELHVGDEVLSVHTSAGRKTHVLTARDYAGGRYAVSWHQSDASARAEQRRWERHMRPLVDPQVLAVVA